MKITHIQLTPCMHGLFTPCLSVEKYPKYSGFQSMASLPFFQNQRKNSHYSGTFEPQDVNLPESIPLFSIIISINFPYTNSAFNQTARIRRFHLKKNIPIQNRQKMYHSLTLFETVILKSVVSRATGFNAAILRTAIQKLEASNMTPIRAAILISKLPEWTRSRTTQSLYVS